ncbi:MAG: hypothetical protein JWO29_1514 [Arthrobacter sp.]|nr:hypothetical protein [Arthrobacter sp.]
MAEELESPVYALRFLADFLDLLPRRIDRILRGLREWDAKQTTDALVSLRVTSSMVGAVDAEAQCRSIETLLRTGRFELASEAGKDLHQTVASLIAAAPDLLLDARLAVRRSTVPRPDEDATRRD